LPLIAAALLADDGTTTIREVPPVKDVEILLKIIEGLGARVEEDRGRRAQVEEDFEIAMAARRSEAMRTLAEADATARAEARQRVSAAMAEAECRVREATEDAERRVAGAEQRVQALRELRQRLAQQLQEVQTVLAEIPRIIAELDERQDGAGSDAAPRQTSSEGAASGLRAQAPWRPSPHPLPQSRDRATRVR